MNLKFQIRCSLEKTPGFVPRRKPPHPGFVGFNQLNIYTVRVSMEHSRKEPQLFQKPGKFGSNNLDLGRSDRIYVYERPQSSRSFLRETHVAMPNPVKDSHNANYNNEEYEETDSGEEQDHVFFDAQSELPAKTCRAFSETTGINCVDHTFSEANVPQTSKKMNTIQSEPEHRARRSSTHSNQLPDEQDQKQLTEARSNRISKLTVSDVYQTSQDMYDDLSMAREAVHLFMNSRMLEAYDMITPLSEKRMYYVLAYALFSTIKAFMTFQHTDLGIAISHCRDALQVASLLRKKQGAIASFRSFVRGTGPSIAWISSMSPVELHAELISVECTLLSAVLGIAHSGDLFSLLTEAFHLRSAYGAYQSLLKFINYDDEHGQTADEHFRSGVFLGTGSISLLLGLLPGKVLKFMEIFGYEGNVKHGLELLCKAGGWSTASEPERNAETEGIRRVVCDMTMLFYHLVVSTFIPVPSVDIPFAEKVLNYHLCRYPKGVFFLYFHGRLYSTQGYSKEAIECFRQARDVQAEYVQLKHICYWDMALCTMSLNAWNDTARYFTILANENNWSKALYNYARAAALYQVGDSKQAQEIMARVPLMRQKIAGKSIPLEKFAARKAMKMKQQGYLVLPAMELAYLTHCYSTSSPSSLTYCSLPSLECELARLGSNATTDDFCLVHFLLGVVLRNIAYPEKHIKAESGFRKIPVEEAAQRAEQSLQFVAQNGARCTYDHYLLYFCHYELGRLYISMGRNKEGREELQLVLSGKNLGDQGRKGKYSMQNMAFLRSNGALDLVK